MKFTTIRLAITLLIGAVIGNSASAGFGIHGGSYGGGSSGGASYGSYGAGYGSSGYAAGYGSSGGASYASSGGGSSGYTAAYGSSGGSSGRPGILSRLHDRIHTHIAAKRARHASYGSSGGYVGGSSGGYVSSYASSGGGSSGGYYSGYSAYSYSGGSSGSVSYGSTGASYAPSYGSTGASYAPSYGSTGAAGYAPSYGSAGSVPYYGTSTTSSRTTSALVSSSTQYDAVRLNVSVPEEAVVYVNDRKTTSTGEVRQFVSRGLEAGKSYRFEVRAELNDNGNIVSDTQTIVVTAGSQENVRFALKATPKANQPVDTAVVLNVPENAEVTLAGNKTQVKGSTRVFKTSQLKEGEVWDDYVVQVKVGDQVKTQSIRLIAGDKLELSFNFDSDKARLASR